MSRPNLPDKSIIERLQYRLAAEEKRKELLPAESDHTLKTIRMSLSSAQLSHTYEATKWKAFLNQFTSFEPHRINLSAGDASAVLYTQESMVNLDTLTGGNTKPGFYVISSTSKVSAAVRKQAEALGVNPNIFEIPSRQEGIITYHYVSDILRMKGIYIFFGRNCINNCIFVYVLR